MSQGKKVSVMLTVEEFTAFQNRLVDMRQKNFALKEEIAELTEACSELPRLKEELAECETLLSSSRDKHQKTLQELRDDLASLQKRVAEQNEANSKRMAERIADITHQITGITQETKEKREKIDQLSQECKVYEARIHEKNQRLAKLKRQAKRYEPLVHFLRNSRGLPMYMEDLTARIERAKNGNTIGHMNSEIDEKVRELKRISTELSSELEQKTLEIDDANRRLKDATLRIADANAEIEKMKTLCDDASVRLEHAKEATKASETENEAEKERIKGAKNALQLKIREAESAKKKFEAQIADIKAKTEQELSQYGIRVQELRRQLSYLKETGDDDTISRIDKDLQSQISRVVEETQTIRDKTQMLWQAIALVEDEIKDKDITIQVLCLKTTPTPEILAMPEFQQKQLLFEELVLQNRNLRNSFAEITEKIVDLKAQNAELRRQREAP